MSYNFPLLLSEDGNSAKVYNTTREQLSIDLVCIYIFTIFFLDINSPVDQVQS